MCSRSDSAYIDVTMLSLPGGKSIFDTYDVLSMYRNSVQCLPTIRDGSINAGYTELLWWETTYLTRSFIYCALRMTRSLRSI